jgi:ELWxxDGT repeat protein
MSSQSTAYARTKSAPRSRADAGGAFEALEVRRLYAAHLVADLNLTPYSPYGPPTAPTRALQVGGVAFFAHVQGKYDIELWKTDGTAAGTARVKDVVPGYLPSLPDNLTRLGSKLLFTAAAAAGPDIVDGAELWVSDGTELGTVRVADVNPTGTDRVSALTGAGNHAFFLANDGTHGQELWVTDGTGGGTHMITDLNPGTAGTTLRAFGTDGDRFFFQTDKQPGALMVSDGTAVGTHRVGTSSMTVNSPLAAYAGGVAFLDTVGGLWTSDGTTATKIVPLTGLARASTLLDGGGGVLFVVGQTSLAATPTLYRYDGGGTFGPVRADTSQVLNSPSSLSAVGGTLYFAATTASAGNELYRVTAGAPAATLAGDLRVGGSSNPAELTDVAGTLYFRATDDAGIGLWRVAGAAAAPQKVTALQPAGSAYVPAGFSALGGLLLFANYDAAAGWEVWRSDGTAAGTARVADACPDTNDSAPGSFTPFTGGALFSADDGVHGRELWSSDGNAAGTTLLKDIAAGPGGSNPQIITPVGDHAYFVATDAEHGAELWFTDGTATGTRLVKDIRVGTAGAGIGDLRPVNGVVYFSADDGVNGAELWRSDGSESGTYQVATIRPGTTSADIIAITPMADGQILFSADDGAHGRELWRSDGTPAGTRLVKDINVATLASGAPAGSSPAYFVRVGDQYLFSAQDDDHGRELWRTDGTPDGTVLVADLNPGPLASSPIDPVVCRDRVYFTAAGDLYRSDGTTAGTTKVAVLDPNGSVSPTSLRVVNNRVTFVSQSTPGSSTPWDRLWSSDGTPDGTVSLLPPGVLDAISFDVSVIGGRLFFVGTAHATSVRELWSSDGTAAGTTLVVPVAGDESGGVIGAPVGLGDGSMLASMSDAYFGAEPWRYDDVWAPRVDSAAFDVARGPSLTLTFSEDVAATMSATDLVIRDLATGQVVPADRVALTYNAGTTAVFSFAGLPDGNFRATLPAGSVSDVAGNPLAADVMLDFFSLAGDANRDRTVDFNDLVKLAQNYNTTGKTWADGDFTGDGSVDFNDLVILAQRYNTSLPAPGPTAAAAPAASASTFAADWAKLTAPATAPIAKKPEPRKAKPTPVFSVTPVAKPLPVKRKTPVHRPR